MVWDFLASAEFVVITLMLATPVCAAQLLIRNAVPILLPGWALRAPDEQRGFNVMGQRLLMTAGNLLVLLFVLLPAACIMGPGLLMRSSGSTAACRWSRSPPSWLQRCFSSKSGWASVSSAGSSRRST